MTEKLKPNKLINEKSPYLLQHAYNPVDWFPWDREAFDKAKDENKPIFLSIGYSTCHWCHVMAHESFEDKEVAAALNKSFVSIKVDKEERPDLDMVYMRVCQMYTGQGGWPTTLLLTPEGEPFFAGNYFPKESRGGMPGLMSILENTAKTWEDRREELLEIGKEMAARLNASTDEGMESVMKEPLKNDLISGGLAQLKLTFDHKNGGFGKSPKFPIPHNILFLLAVHEAGIDDRALEMAEHTLTQMYRGGIFDHIGGGFCRYSTDAYWLLPHFEKMLYDNAFLAYAYTEAYRIAEDNLYKDIAKSILDYTLRDMTAPTGGFYSAQDADSEGEEGKYYVFIRDEIVEQLGEEAGQAFSDAYDINKNGNFEGRSIPNLLHNRNFREGSNIFKSQKEALLDYRTHRMGLHKDDKILTSWNGMMVAAMAFAANVLRERVYLDAAEKAAEFIEKELTKKDGRLKVRYRDRESGGNAFLDDYAFYTWGLLELYETTRKVNYLQKALDFNSRMMAEFTDEKEGGFFFTGVNTEKLIWRPKETYDGATPSGNSIVAWNLFRLANKMSSAELMEKAEAQLRFLAGKAGSYPQGHSMTLFVMTRYLKDK
ncbi:thioredoxin domain-containing protein [Bacillota bacterium]